MADVLLSVTYGVLAYAASYFAHRFIASYRVPKDARRWTIELEEDIIGLVRAHLTVAAYRTGLAEKIDHVPKDFEEPLLVASELGFVVERAVQAEVERRGITHPRSWRLDKNLAPPMKATAWLKSFFTREDYIKPAPGLHAGDPQRQLEGVLPALVEPAPGPRAGDGNEDGGLSSPPSLRGGLVPATRNFGSARSPLVIRGRVIR